MGFCPKGIPSKKKNDQCISCDSHGFYWWIIKAWISLKEKVPSDCWDYHDGTILIDGWQDGFWNIKTESTLRKIRLFFFQFHLDWLVWGCQSISLCANLFAFKDFIDFLLSSVPSNDLCWRIVDFPFYRGLQSKQKLHFLPTSHQ